MSTISLEKDVAIELINSKLRSLKSQIKSILDKRQQESSDAFIKKSRLGELPESEMDALSLTNLVEAKKKYEELLISIEK